MVIFRITVKETKEFVTGHSLQDLVKEWEREVVFASDSIQFTIVNTNSPTDKDMSWNKFAFLIGDYRHSGFLRDDLGRTYLLAIGYKVDDTHIQQFDDLSPHFFFHIQI